MIFLGEIEKNIVIVSNKSVRIYDIRNGALIKVIKGIFNEEQNSNIFCAQII